MSKIVTLMVAMFSFAWAQAQKISGTVKDEQGKPVNGASVSLFKEKDSVKVVKIAVVDNNGTYTFVNIANGSYYAVVNSVGYTIAKSAVFQVNGKDVTVPALSIAKVSKELGGVTVTSRKPMIEVKADKTVFNVESSINAVGSDALELLRKSPGVLVDRDDNLSLSGKNGVQVYIDGRPSPLTGKDLADFLRSLNSSQIEAIEIITNPSAKYDAAGNAGIINIRLKKNKLYGLNGNANAGYGIGVYSKYNAGVGLNFRDDKVNLYGNYGYSNNLNENFMFLKRTLADSFFNQAGTITTKNITHNFKAGLDYFIDNKNTFGVIVTGNLNDGNTDNYSKTPITYLPTNTGVKTLIADNSQTGKRDNININTNYRYADSAGRELNFDANYGFFNITSDQFQPNAYYNFAGNVLEYYKAFNLLSPSDIDIYNAKIDYEQNFKKGRLSFGGKWSYVKTTNNFSQFNTSKDRFLDTKNDFDYKENINALYANYNKQFKGFMIQVGLRMENTHAKGHSRGSKLVNSTYVLSDSTFDRNYTDFFPSAAITLNKNPMSQWSLSYSRRIDRPGYQDLNPFEFRLDDYTFQKGNTLLTPQYTNSFGLTHSYKYRLTTTLNYSRVTDIFSQLIDTAAKSKSFITKKNLAQQDIISLNVSYPFQYKWYTVFGNLNAYYSHYKADFGGGNRVINLDVYAFNFYAQNTFRLGKGYTAELSGWYTSPSIWQGTFKSKAMGGVDAGLQKTIMQGKGNIKVAVSDIFRTMRWAGTSDFSGQTVQANGGWESRQFKVNFTYRFGKTTVKSARQRKTGVEDESNRAQSGGGGLGGN